MPSAQGKLVRGVSEIIVFRSLWVEFKSKKSKFKRQNSKGKSQKLNVVLSLVNIGSLNLFDLCFLLTFIEKWMIFILQINEL
jgi:hypothetical protein